MSVDLPEPDGPQTTITSPFSTLVVQSVRTWNWPYHFETSLMAIMGMARSSTNHGDLLLQPLHAVGQRVAQHEIDDGDERVHFDQTAVALRDLRRGAGEVGRRDHVDQRSILEQYDRLREQHRDHVAERLGQDHEPHRLPVGEP